MFLVYLLFFDKNVFGFRNDHYYVGQHHTTKINDGYFGSGKKVQDIYRKYGKKNVKKEILAITEDKNACDVLEIFFIKTYIEKYGNNQVLNIAKGGSGAIPLDKQYMIEAHKKQALSLKKTWEEHPEKFFERNKRISSSMKGNKNGLGHYCKHTEATKIKISESLKKSHDTRCEAISKVQRKNVYVLYKDGTYKVFDSVKYCWKDIGFTSETTAQRFIRYCSELENINLFNYKFDFFASYNEFDVKGVLDILKRR